MPCELTARLGGPRGLGEIDQAQRSRVFSARQPFEEIMELPNFTVEELKQLPLRAIVAFAARCARRVKGLAQLPEGHPQREKRRDAVEAALRLAEGFSSGSGVPPDESVIEAIDASRGASVAATRLGNEEAAAAVAEAAHAASCAWGVISGREGKEQPPFELKTDRVQKLRGNLEHVTADLAALHAFTAASEAFGAVGYRNEQFVAAALNDYQRLCRLQLGRFPEPGVPIDPSPGGPLGPL